MIDVAASTFDAYSNRFPNRGLDENLKQFMQDVKDAYLIDKIRDVHDDDVKRLIFNQLSAEADLTNLLPKLTSNDKVVINLGQIDFLIGVMTGAELLKRVTLHASVKESLQNFILNKLG